MDSADCLQCSCIQEQYSGPVYMWLAPDDGGDDDTVILLAGSWTWQEHWFRTVHVLLLPRGYVSCARVNFHEFSSIVRINVAGYSIEVSVMLPVEMVVVDGGSLAALVADDGGLHHHRVLVDDVSAGGARAGVQAHLVMMERRSGLQR